MPRIPGFKRSGKTYKRPTKGGSKFLRLIRAIFSGIFMTAGILLVLWAFGELMVRVIEGPNGAQYVDWGSVPLLLLGASLPFFILYIVINYDRIGWVQRILSSIKRDKAPQEIETVELD